MTTTTRNTHTTDVSGDEVLEAASLVVVGGGLITMALFPLALPLIFLVVAPLIAVGLVAGVVAAIVLAPVLLFRWARSRVASARAAHLRRLPLHGAR